MHVPAPSLPFSLLCRSCQINSSGAVDYKQFLQLINWREHPLPTTHSETVSHTNPLSDL